MDVLILIFLALSAAILAWSFRRPSVSLALPEPVAPVVASQGRRVVNPRNAAPAVKVWVLRACPECSLTKSLLDGHRYRTEDALPLPLVGCRQHDCRCRYEPVSEARHGERREGAERRDEIRFETRRDRRYGSERRHTNGWAHTMPR